MAHFRSKADWKRVSSLLILVLPMAGLMSHSLSQVALAQTKVPLEGQSGIIEKSLRQSRPFKPVPEPEAPQITIESSRTLKDPKAGPVFFVKKIKLTGNTVISDELLMPLVDLGDGK